MKKAIFLDIISYLFIFLFLYTGLSKILEHEVFRTALFKSPLLGNYALFLSILVPLAELLTAIALLIPRTRRLGLYGFLVLMSIFAIYVGFMLYFRSDRPCTCGGIIKYMNWHQHFYFNSGFTLLAILALWLDKKLKQQDLKQMNKISYAY